MNLFAPPDWHEMFVPAKPLLEILIRGTLVYLALFAMLRVLQREAGTVSITDLLAIVLIADAAQNAMADSYQSITEGLILVVTILFWDWFLDFIAYYVPPLGRVIHPPPLALIENG